MAARRYTEASARRSRAGWLEQRIGILTRDSNGQVKIWNYETQTDLKTFEVTDVPVRCVRYIARKNWVCLSPSTACPHSALNSCVE